jgi:hypothetical protein
MKKFVCFAKCVVSEIETFGPVLFVVVLVLGTILGLPEHAKEISAHIGR